MNASMELKEFGLTGVRLPEIGTGTWQYQGGTGPLLAGLANGAFLIDTAEVYGTEAVVGEAIAGLREKVFIATKVSGEHLGYDDILKAADASLKRLGTDQIDLYQIHWPNSRFPIEDTMRAMESLVSAGKVRFIGVSNFSVAEMKRAQEALGSRPIVSNQVLYNLSDRKIERDLLPYCQERGICVLAYSPLARGGLTSKPPLRHRDAMEVLQRVADENGKSMAQVALNWLTAKPQVIAIPKANHAERVEENCLASGWRLSEAQIDELDLAFH